MGWESRRLQTKRQRRVNADQFFFLIPPKRTMDEFISSLRRPQMSRPETHQRKQQMQINGTSREHPQFHTVEMVLELFFFRRNFFFRAPSISGAPADAVEKPHVLAHSRPPQWRLALQPGLLHDVIQCADSARRELARPRPLVVQENLECRIWVPLVL